MGGPERYFVVKQGHRAQRALRRKEVERYQTELGTHDA